MGVCLLEVPTVQDDGVDPVLSVQKEIGICALVLEQSDFGRTWNKLEFGRKSFGLGSSMEYTS